MWNCQRVFPVLPRTPREWSYWVGNPLIASPEGDLQLGGWLHLFRSGWLTTVEPAGFFKPLSETPQAQTALRAISCSMVTAHEVRSSYAEKWVFSHSPNGYHAEVTSKICGCYFRSSRVDFMVRRDWNHQEQPGQLEVDEVAPNHHWMNTHRVKMCHFVCVPMSWVHGSLRNRKSSVSPYLFILLVIVFMDHHISWNISADFPPIFW